MLKTIIFDLGGVYFCDGTRIAIETIATKYKIDHKAVGSVLNGALGKI